MSPGSALALLLALALLGAVPARPPAPGPAPRPGVAAPRPEVAAPRPGVPAGASRGRQFRYLVVKKFRTYAGAQRHCREQLRGHLASVHSAAVNRELQQLAATYTRVAPWIGAVTSYQGGQWASQWEDTSPWNFANWALGQPNHLFRTCTTLSTRDGLWRSSACFKLRPFICQY